MNNKQFIAQVKLENEIFGKIIKAGQDLLLQPAASACKEYIDSRLSEFSVNKYQFAYFPDKDNFHLLLDKVGKEHLQLVKIAYENYGELSAILHHHNIIFPIKDDYGNIVSLVGRTLIPKDRWEELKIGKYKYSPHFKTHVLYGLNFAKNSIRKTKKVFIVEGQIDCISCHAAGYHNVVALGGTSLSFYQYYLLRKYGGPNLKIYVLTDNDIAGDKCFKKISDNYSKFSVINRVSIPNPYKDIDEYLKKDSSGDLLAIY